MIKDLHNKNKWLKICALIYNTMITKVIIYTNTHTHTALSVCDIFIVKLCIESQASLLCTFNGAQKFYVYYCVIIHKIHQNL